MYSHVVKTVDGHTAGEPLRIIADGIPQLPGSTMLERRRHAIQHINEFRTILMWEPRGHRDMYGAILTPPATEDGDVGVLFMHNDGFSTMCGHGIIALASLGPGEGLVPLDWSNPLIRFDTPAGRVVARVRHDNRRIEDIAFCNVPSFVVDVDASVHVPGLGDVRYDLAFGGAFYAYVDAASVGLELVADQSQRIVDVSMSIKRELIQANCLGDGVLGDELDFLYGVILTGPAHGEAHSRNVCVFADGEVDRSPTGTGVSGRIAIHHHRGEVGLGEHIRIESILGTTFDVAAVETLAVDDRDAVVPEVTGMAYLTGRHEFVVDPMDPLGTGFLLGS
ncbi:MAG: proline racemase family protein [Phycisphaerales bacterium]|nr:proline racemase family protein [Phycisphaerales bacterium]